MNGNKEISTKKHKVTNTRCKKKGTNVKVKEKIKQENTMKQRSDKGKQMRKMRETK